MYAVPVSESPNPISRPRVAGRRVDGRRESAERRLEKARDYLKKHFFENLDINDLALIANMSPFHFSRTYRRLFGIGPLADLSEQRVVMAEHLLASTDLDVRSIAAAVGFTSRTTLFRQFVRARGRSPLYFRREAKRKRQESLAVTWVGRSATFLREVSRKV